MVRTSDEALDALEAMAVRAGKLELTIESVRRDDERFYVTVRLIVFDEDDLICNIKEQELGVQGPLFHDVNRLAAFARGHGDALRMVFESPTSEIDRLMPHDLVHFAVLELVRPQRAEEFTHALLTKKRLGALLRA